MSLDFHADMQNVLVRMVVPMRREFGCALDVQKMRRNPAYAEAIVAQALTSQVQSLRDSARLVGYHLGAAKAAQEPSPPTAERAAPAAELRQSAARAARLLIDLVGPMGESLAIRLERASDSATLAQFIGEARARIASVRGEAAADDYVGQAASAGTPSSTAAPTPVSAAALRRAAKHAAQEFVHLIGPLGRLLAERIERATDATSLSSLIDKAHEGITAAIGVNAADAWLRRVSAQP